MGKKNTIDNIVEFSDEELSNFKKNIGMNVAKLRKEKCISQLDLSHMIGCSSVSLVSAAEIGFNGVKFNLDHLYKIAKVLEVDVREFFKPIES